MDNHRIKGKEYIQGILVFEVEYLYDRKFNGKGFDENDNKIYDLINGNGTVIIYNNDYSIYEGEYKNGKENGKGKLYYNGYLLYEGEFKNGKANGKGKKFDNYGKLVFEGEFLNDKPYGQGKFSQRSEHKKC